MLYVADTYNSKIKAIDLQQRTVTTLAGTEEDPQSVSLDEPAGISYAAGKLFIADTNNHAIRVIELASGKMATLAIAGLTAPEPAPQKKRKPSFPGAKQVKVPAQMVKTSEGKLKVVVELTLPEGWKINPLAPMGYLVELPAESGPVDREAVGEYVRVKEPAKKIEFTLPAEASGTETLKVSMNYYYCEVGDNGVCKTGAVIWTAPVELSTAAEAPAATLKYKVDE